MSDQGWEIEPASTQAARRDVRLILDVSFSPDSIAGTRSAEDGAATPFESWLGLAHGGGESRP